ncbi:hypothetical protein [Desulforamulus putei]|uniref:hypothetical protein n=1 Tax=Desulforamulus putei TaxID=74701 RepID=UPI002FDE01E8
MSEIKDFFQQESEFLLNLCQQFAPEYHEQVQKSFIQSPLLPKGSFNLLLAGKGKPDSSLYEILAFTAYDSFAKAYLEQLCAYVSMVIRETAVEAKLPESKDEEISLDHVLNYLEVLTLDDLVLEWFVATGAPNLNQVRKQLSVSNIEQLSDLVRQLEYYVQFFTDDPEKCESFSFLVDILERLPKDMEELELLQIDRVWMELLRYKGRETEVVFPSVNQITIRLSVTVEENNQSLPDSRQEYLPSDGYSTEKRYKTSSYGNKWNKEVTIRDLSKVIPGSGKNEETSSCPQSPAA